MPGDSANNTHISRLLVLIALAVIAAGLAVCCASLVALVWLASGSTVPLAPLILTIAALCCGGRIFLRSQRLMRGQASGPAVSRGWERGLLVILVAPIGFSVLTP